MPRINAVFCLLLWVTSASAEDPEGVETIRTKRRELRTMHLTSLAIYHSHAVSLPNQLCIY